MSLHRITFFLFVFIAFTGFSPSAKALFHLGFSLNATKSSPRSTGGGTYTAYNYLPGFGLLFGLGGTLSPVSLEADLLLMGRSFEVSELSDVRIGSAIHRVTVTATVEQYYAHLPVMTRWRIVRDYFTLGLGGYYAKALGPLRVRGARYAFSSGATTPGTLVLTRPDSEFGAVASLRLMLPVGVVTRLIVDGRYLYGLKRILNKGNARASDFQGLIGLALAI